MQSLRDNTKRCCACKEIKPARDFNKNYAKCKPCFKAYQATPAQRAVTLNREAERRRLVDSIKDVPCTDCGNRYPPYVMDFDHVNGTKTGLVSKMRLHSPIDRVLDEIEKCEVVCSNCHRIRTHKRLSKMGATALP